MRVPRKDWFAEQRWPLPTDGTYLGWRRWRARRGPGLTFWGSKQRKVVKGAKASGEAGLSTVPQELIPDREASFSEQRNL